MRSTTANRTTRAFEWMERSSAGPAARHAATSLQHRFCGADCAAHIDTAAELEGRATPQLGADLVRRLLVGLRTMRTPAATSTMDSGIDPSIECLCPRQ